ncbi:MAG: succinate dehydrogenase/fumarate reductase flavoprotein subunit, partial [Proteobacteria bacterium]|nr:succinate dehydrogenase/fumarate reductase flavoprotein subunit [Pseudomonadota bacterium]
LDLLVFGKAAGDHIVEFNKQTPHHKPLPANALDATLARLNRLEEASDGEYAQTIANDIRSTMQTHAGVFRTQAVMDEGVVKVAELRQRVKNVGLQDHSKIFNTARVEALEVENLIEVAQATMMSAAARKECRGAHTVEDYEHPADHPTAPLGRDDVNWLKHTLWHSQTNSLSYKPVRLKPLSVETIPPKVRTF